ncbi:hypothetical protein [Micromonospora sp. CA-111912]|uniref:hypothetical protein n=1 Tax=Micromonospora sp. CA-111912 TaxID=3239955 RepID=UPI003D91D86F
MTAVVFDLDGVPVNSHEVTSQAFSVAYAEAVGSTSAARRRHYARRPAAVRRWHARPAGLAAGYGRISPA